MRLLLAAVLAAGALGGGTAHATCASAAVCAVSGCTGTVNVCPTADRCSGGVSICPMADPDDCASSVDVCLDLVGPAVVDCGDLLDPVCDLVP